MKIVTQSFIVLTLISTFSLYSMKKAGKMGHKVAQHAIKHSSRGLIPHHHRHQHTFSEEEIRNAYNNITLPSKPGIAQTFDIDKLRQRQEIEKAAEGLYSAKEIEEAFTNFTLPGSDILNIDKLREREKIVEAINKRMREKPLTSGFRKLFIENQKREYGTQVRRNRNNEEESQEVQQLPWWKRWWAKVFGGAASFGISAYKIIDITDAEKEAIERIYLKDYGSPLPSSDYRILEREPRICFDGFECTRYKIELLGGTRIELYVRGRYPAPILPTSNYLSKTLKKMRKERESQKK